MSVIERIAYVDGGVVCPPAHVDVLRLADEAVAGFFVENGYDGMEPSVWEQREVYAAIPSSNTTEVPKVANEQGLCNVPPAVIGAVAVVYSQQSPREDLQLHVQYFPGSNITHAASARVALRETVSDLASKRGAEMVVDPQAITPETRY